ncbi:MAG TPA: hypothetical protein VGJ84_02560 [Polyangiaceae bacterium]
MREDSATEPSSDSDGDRDPDAGRDGPEGPELSVSWKIVVWLISLALAGYLIWQGAGTVVRAILQHGRLLLMGWLIRPLQIAGGVLILFPRTRFNGALVIIVATVCSFLLLRPPQVGWVPWLEVHGMFVVLAGIVAFKTMPPGLRAKLPKKEQSPPVF